MMDKHIDVIGYLLVVIVFSVSFLIERHQTFWRERLSTASDASWQVRDALARGDRVMPEDIATALLDAASDPVARLTLILNRLLALCVFTVSVDAGRLLLGGRADHSTDAGLLVAMLTLATVAVIVLSEYTVHVTTQSGRRDLAPTALGRLQLITASLAKSETAQIPELVRELRGTFPGWQLLDEIEAMAALVGGDLISALDRCQRMVEESPEAITLTPAIAVSAAVLVGEPQRALPILDTIRRGSASHTVSSMRRGVGLVSCELDQLINPPGDGDHLPKTTRASTFRSAVSAEALHQSVLLDPELLDACAEVRKAARDWDSDGRDPIDMSGYVSSIALVQAVVMAEDAPQLCLDTLVLNATEAMSVPLLETAAVMLLAWGRGPDAEGPLVSAIQLRPAEHRTQWLLGLACRSKSWDDAAEAAFHNALQLAPPDYPLNGMTLELAAGRAVVFKTADAGLYWQGHRVYDELRVLAALAGCELPSPSGSPSRRRQFVDRLVTIALHHSLTTAATGG